jgi:hypothetical protein
LLLGLGLHCGVFFFFHVLGRMRDFRNHIFLGLRDGDLAFFKRDFNRLREDAKFLRCDAFEVCDPLLRGFLGFLLFFPSLAVREVFSDGTDKRRVFDDYTEQ